MQTVTKIQGVEIKTDDRAAGILLSDMGPEEKAAALMGGYSQAELEAAWAKVAPEGDWKMPVNRVVHCFEEDAECIRFAITYFTASEPTVTKMGFTGYHFRAAGYYAACG
jgi:hypothetical protein